MRNRTRWILAGAGIVVLCGILIAQAGPPASVPNWPQGMKWGFGYDNGGGDIDSDGYLRAQNVEAVDGAFDQNVTIGGNLTVDGDTTVQDIYLGGQIIGLTIPDPVPTPDSETAFLLSTDYDPFDSANTTAVMSALGFVGPILDRASPGDIGLDTPAFAVFTGVVSGFLDSFQLDPNDPPAPGSAPLSSGNATFGGFVYDFLGEQTISVSHKTEERKGGTEWVNRHLLIERWDVHEGSGATDQDVVDSTRAYLDVMRSGTSDAYEDLRPFWSFTTMPGSWVLVPSQKELSQQLAGWWKTGIVFDGNGINLRDNHEISFGNRNANDPRDPEEAYTGNAFDPRFRFVESSGDLLVQTSNGSSYSTSLRVNADGSVEIPTGITLIINGTIDVSDGTIIEPTEPP